MTPIETAANDHKSAGRYPHPFNTPELGYIVTIAGYDGLYEALEPTADGRWIFRVLNTEGPPLVSPIPMK